MPQHHPVIDRLGDRDAVVHPQHARGRRAEDPHRRLVRVEIVINEHPAMMAPVAQPARTSRQVPQWRQRQLDGRAEMPPADAVKHPVVSGKPATEFTDRGERRGPLGLAYQPFPDSVGELVFVVDPGFSLA
jgi:hypothetical protein